MWLFVIRFPTPVPKKLPEPEMSPITCNSAVGLVMPIPTPFTPSR